MSVRPAAPRMNRPTRTVPDNEAMLERIVRRLLTDARRRGSDFAFGELTFRMTFEAGIVKHFKVNEETIVKPDDPETTP